MPTERIEVVNPDILPPGYESPTQAPSGSDIIEVIREDGTPILVPASDLSENAPSYDLVEGERPYPEQRVAERTSTVDDGILLSILTVFVLFFLGLEEGASLLTVVPMLAWAMLLCSSLYAWKNNRVGVLPNISFESRLVGTASCLVALYVALFV